MDITYYLSGDVCFKHTDILIYCAIFLHLLHILLFIVMLVFLDFYVFLSF